MPGIRFSRGRVVLFFGCWAAFWLMGGFSPPGNTLGIPQGLFDSNAGDAWFNCFVMFFVGAVSMSLVEHKIGVLEPVSIRAVYVLAGGGLMAGSLVWWHAIKAGF